MINSLDFESIDYAVSDAIAAARARNGQTRLSQDSDGDTFIGLADYDDDTSITGIWDKPWIKADDEVLVDTPEELRYCMYALGQQIGGYIPSRQIDQLVGHEVEHGKAMNKLGINTIRYGMLVTEASARSAGWQPFCFSEEVPKPVTKLEFAAVTAVPTTPSEGDVLRIQQMGYGSIRKFVRKLIKHNRQLDEGGEPLPLPSNYLY